MDSARADVRTLTSPGDRRSAPDVGRRARLELVFERRRGRTVLAHGYAEPPLRVGRWFAAGEGARMILASSSPGVFGGDEVEQTVVIGPGAEVHLTSQSAQQIHPTPDGLPARIRTCYHVASEAVVCCHWDPLIPFAGSWLEHDVEIELEEGSGLYWSDALMSGRCAHGERWQFARLAHQLRLRRRGRLQYLERYTTGAVDIGMDGAWRGADATHFSTTLLAGDSMVRDPRRLNEEIAAVPGIRGAADSPDPSLTVMKLMASSGAAFRTIRDHFMTHYTGVCRRTGGC